MRCLDATFLIDYLAGDSAAVARAREWEDAGERVTVPAPAAAETLIGAYFKGGAYLREALGLIANLEVLPVDAVVADEAGRLGAEQLRRGIGVSLVDLLIAAATKLNQGVLDTRDRIFAQIPGLAVEAY